MSLSIYAIHVLNSLVCKLSIHILCLFILDLEELLGYSTLSPLLVLNTAKHLSIYHQSANFCLWQYCLMLSIDQPLAPSIVQMCYWSMTKWVCSRMVFNHISKYAVQLVFLLMNKAVCWLTFQCKHLNCDVFHWKRNLTSDYKIQIFTTCFML